MNEEIERLEEEIELLQKRVNILENSENRRKAAKYISIIFKILMILLMCFGIWKGYDYIVNEIPNMMEEKIKSLNPFRSNK